MTDPGYSGDMNYGGGYGYQPPADPKLKQRGTVALGLSLVVCSSVSWQSLA